MRPTAIDADPWMYAGRHLVHVSARLSPVSDYRGFLGSRRFFRVNEWLVDRGIGSIDWCLVQLRQGLCVGRGASASISTLKSNPS